MSLARRARLPEIGLAAGALLITLLALEGVARFALRGMGGGKEQNETSLYMEHDPRRGWRHKPGARATYRRREYTTEVAIDAHGLREVARSAASPPGAYRVLALGDSFVEGYSVHYGQTVTQVAERALSSTGCPVEVLNGGHAGYSTDQEYLFYRDQAHALRPKAVLLFLYYNDILANTIPNYFGAPKPLFAVRDGALVLANEPVPAPPLSEPPAPEAPRPPRAWRGSVALEWVRDRMARGAPRAYNVVAGTGLWPRLGGHEVPRGDQLRVYKRRRQWDVEEAWTVTSGLVLALAREARERGARFALVYVPSRMEVSDRDWELTRILYDMDAKVWDRGLVAVRAAEIARVGGFPVLDLTPALRKAMEVLGREPYFLYDGHWNASGHEAAGKAVAEFLRAEGWLPACAGGAPR